MRASIIIVVYNGKRYLEACIDSVLREISTEDEVIVVDNASTDGSADLVEGHWPQVRVIRNAANLGFANGCKQAAGQAWGDILVFLNQDTQVQPGWLNGLSAHLEEDNSVGLVTSKLVLMSQPEKIQTCGLDIHFTGFSFGRGFLGKSGGYQHSEYVGAVSGASFAIRRPLWEQLGGFDPDIFMYYEETDLSWRAWLAGFSSVYCPESIAYHDYSTDGLPQVYAYNERNRLVLLLKNWKIRTLLLLLPSLIIAEGVDWGYMFLIGKTGIQAKVEGWRWLLKNINTVTRARAEAQRARKEPDWVLLKTCTCQLTPRIFTGGKIGELIIRVCNIWFTLHYKAVLSLTENFNI